MSSRFPRSPHQAFLPALLSLIWALGGCAGDAGTYPSLASRPDERLSDTAQVVTPQAANPGNPTAAPAAPSAALVARLVTLTDQANSAARDFARQQAATARLVNAVGAAPIGSEAWASATQALSGLEAARSLTAQPLADLDRIDIEDHVTHAGQVGPDGSAASRPDAIAIAQARASVAALVADEDAALAKLDGRLAH